MCVSSRFYPSSSSKMFMKDTERKSDAFFAPRSLKKVVVLFPLGIAHLASSVAMASRGLEDPVESNVRTFGLRRWTLWVEASIMTRET